MGKTKCFGIVASVAVMSLGVTSSIDAQQAPPQAPNMTFFVAAGNGKGGDLGGINGADARCQQLATQVGAGNKVWRAYLSTSANAGSVSARERIGKGPWQNQKGTVIATSVDDLHSANNKLTRENSLTERGNMVSGFGMTPNWHDVLTGSTPEGRAYPGNMALTCNNWTSSNFGSAMLGHIDRRGGADTDFQKSWNSAHQSRACSQEDLVATGGNGMFYCFAAN
jgi:hypothetical protein